MADQLSEADILKLSKCKDGDVIVVASDGTDVDKVHRLGDLIRKTTGKKIAVIGLPAGDSITVLEASEAKAILEYIAKNGPTT